MKTSMVWQNITSEYRARCNRLIQADRVVIASNICSEGRPPEMIEAIRAIKLVLFAPRLDSKQLYAKLPDNTVGGPGDKLHPNRIGYQAMGMA